MSATEGWHSAGKTLLRSERQRDAEGRRTKENEAAAVAAAAAEVEEKVKVENSVGGRWVKGSGPEPHFIFMQLLISVEPDTRRVPSLPLPVPPSSLLLALPRPSWCALRPTRPPATAPLAALYRRATLCPFRGRVAAGN